VVPNGQVLLDPTPPQFAALHHLGACVSGALPLELGGFGHDRLRPGSLKETGLTWLIGGDFRQWPGGADGPAFEAAGDVADHAVEGGAEAGHAAPPHPLEDPPPAKALRENFLAGIPPPRRQPPPPPSPGPLGTDA